MKYFLIILCIVLLFFFFSISCESSNGDSTNNTTNSSIDKNSTNNTNSSDKNGTEEDNEEQELSMCEKLQNQAQALEGSPYVWGAEGPDSFDCSGFIYFVSHQVGRPLPRTTSQKYYLSIESNEVHWKNATCGHLVWWTFEPDRPFGHIGYMVVNPKFWQSGSSGGVYSRKFFNGSFWDNHFKAAKPYF